MPHPSSHSIDAVVYDYLVTPVARRLCGHVHPNTITFIALLFVAVLGWALCSPSVGVGGVVVLFLVRYYMDCLDGEVARECRQQSDFGALFDVVSDAIATCVLNLIVIVTCLRRGGGPLRIGLVALLLLPMIAHSLEIAKEVRGRRSTQPNYGMSPIEQTMHNNVTVLAIAWAVVLKLAMSSGRW